MSAEAEHAAPLTRDAESAAASPEAAPPFGEKNRRFRRRCLLCVGGACVAVLIVLGIVVLVLALTVFRFKDPVVTVNFVSLDGHSLDLGNSLSQPLSLNVTLVSGVSVKNPNAVGFRFGNTATGLYYRGQEMGVAYGPPGDAPAHRTFSVNLTVDVMADRLTGDSSVFDDLVGGSLPFTSSTMASGRMKLLGSIRRHVDVRMNCSFTMAVANQSILERSCKLKVWL